MTRNQEIAKIILDQIGGINKIAAMIGASNFVAIENGIQFKFKGSKIFNCIRIEVNGLDLYNVTFYKLGKYGEIKREETIENLFNQFLKMVFENATGLYLSL